MSCLTHKRNFTDRIRKNPIELNKNIHYVVFDNVIVIGDFNEMKYYYLDSWSSIFYTHILESKNIDAAAKNLENIIETPKEEFIYELIEWCVIMCERGIFRIKKRGV